MLSAIALILAFQVVGEVISRSAGIPVPGPVIGMILMLLAFFVKDDLIGRIRPTGGVLYRTCRFSSCRRAWASCATATFSFARASPSAPCL